MYNFRKRLILAVAGLFFGFFIMSCSQTRETFATSNPCGENTGTENIDGLTWIAGTPGQTNVLCEVRQQQGRVLQSLEPDSRDPILFRDSHSGWNFLVERFSGRQSRPSRITWFSTEGRRLGQRGDWPNNVYGISLTSTGDALVTGYDSGIVQPVNWQTENFASLASTAKVVSTSGAQHPIQTLNRSSWFAVVDNGYDLIRFEPADVKVFVFDSSDEKKQPRSVVVEDPKTGVRCQNAFQTLSLSASEILISCNPQYFGPVTGTTVAVFKVGLTSDGEISVRELVHFDGGQIQRIDLWGLNERNSQVFLGYKKTSIDDYDGQVFQAGWMQIESREWTPESRFSGPLHRLQNRNGTVVACVEDRGSCTKGRFVLLNDDDVRTLNLRSQLPFLSFAQELRKE